MTVTGRTDRRLTGLDLSVAHFSGLSIQVVFILIPMLHDHDRQVHGEILATLAKFALNGSLKPVLDDLRFAFKEIGAGHVRLGSGQAIGLVVIEL